MGSWEPIIDGDALPDGLFLNGSEKMSKNVPLIIGSTLNEFGGRKYDKNIKTWDEVKADLAKTMGEKAGKYVDEFRKTYPNDNIDAFYRLDMMVRPAAIEQINTRVADGGAPVWNYLFAYQLPSEDGEFHDLLIGSLYGLYKYASGQCTAIPLVSGLQLPSVSCIEQTGLKNQFWIGTYNHLLRYNAETGQSKIEKELGNIVVKSINLVNGTLVIAADDGLYIYKDKRIKHMVHDSKDPFSLGNNIVWSILHDQWNNIILGTDDGLSIISQTNLYAYHSIASLSGSSVGNSLSHIFQDSFGEQWLGGTSGIIRLNPTVAWFKQNDKQNPISHNRIRTIFEDSDRNLLISTDIGINIYERTKGRMRNLMLYDEKKKHAAKRSSGINAVLTKTGLHIRSHLRLPRSNRAIPTV